MTTSTAWTIAGSDSSGGAGIQADLLTFQNLNVHGCTVITAATAQNAHDVHSIHDIPPQHIKSQLDSLYHSHAPDAIKIGMLGNHNTIELLEGFLQTCAGKIILDPVMVSTSGKYLFNSNPQDYLKKLITLFPYIDLITPNLPEAETLLNRKIESYEDMRSAAHELLTLGVKSVVIKSGHFKQDTRTHDYWTNGTESFWLSCPRYEKKNYRGSGCVFSSAVTASIASGFELKDALVIAKMYINRGIRLSRHQTGDAAFIYHSGWPDDSMDLPYLSDTPLHEPPLLFNSCGPEPIGLYPVVDNPDWVKRLLPMGVKMIQLRIKDKNGSELENEIKLAIELAKQNNARLFINDYWELALSHGAYGVHLGQEDLKTADIKQIHAAGLRLGISTHCYHEVARAHACRPSYIACGPIFPTHSKIMPFMPQGLEKLQYWRRLLRDYSLVAIGGINTDKILDVIKTGVDGVAMISAITQAHNPEQRTKKLLTIMNRPQ